MGKEISNVRIKLEEQLGRTINILQISTRDEEIDIYNKCYGRLFTLPIADAALVSLFLSIII